VEIGVNFMKSLRSLGSRPGPAIVSVITLALGLGANTAIFSLTREMLLRPLPYRDADRLVRVFESSRALEWGAAPVRPTNFVAWRERVDAFEQTAIFRRVAMNVAMKTSAVQVEAFIVDANFFPMLGIQPALGRGFGVEDTRPGRDTVVVLSDGFWRRRFGADPSVIGETIDVDGTPCTIAGILPTSFRLFRVLDREVELFRPFVLDATDREQSLNVYAKLKTGVPLDTARAQLAAAYASLPNTDRLWTADAEPLSKSFAAQSRSMLLALQWAVALVLLIACANIANVLLAASAGRQRELAVRQALGAGLWRIARDLLGETVVLTAAGGLLAILLAGWIVRVLNTNVSFQVINRLHPFRVDGWVLLFTGVLTLVVTTIFGLLPARVAGAIDVVETLKDSSHGGTPGVSNRRLRFGLIVGELALSIVLTAAAVALTRSAVALHDLPRGVAVDRVMTAQVSLQGPRYDDTNRLTRTATAMGDRLAGAPEIASAAIVNYPPMSVIRVGIPVAIDGVPPPQPNQPWIARYWVVSRNYFRIAGIPIRRGRDFQAADDSSRPGVAIVSESFARRFWNSLDVIGRRVKTEFPPSNLFWIPRARREWLTIIAVVGDVREDGLPRSDDPQLYLPYAQNPTTTITLMGRTSGPEAGTVTRAIREAVRGVDPEAPVSYESSMDDIIRETFARPREMAWLLGAFAALALTLSAVGVYGVMSVMTAARTREIGIRIALGATFFDIVRLIVGHAVLLTAAGTGFGLIVIPMVLRLLSSMLFGVTPFDAATLLAGAGLLATVSIAAAFIPALRATRLASATFR